MKDNIVYFELNNWFAGENYPNAEPFTTWCADEHLYFLDEDFVKKNKLCVAADIIDMSVNFCITAPKEFVLEHCPKLLSDEVTIVESEYIENGKTTTLRKEYPYSNYLCYPNEKDIVEGQWGTKFLKWSPENIGVHYMEEETDG